MRALFELWPALDGGVRFAHLAELPTPVAPLARIAEALGRSGLELYVKRDDLTSPVYGGNKVRTLEVLIGDALERGSTHLYSTGAYGSNHAAAAALHAPRVGLVPGIVVYPQPHSPSALANLEMMLSRTPRPPVLDLPHWSALPFGMWRQARLSRGRSERATIMVPGGAVPLGSLGYVSAGLELALQVKAGELPRPRTVVVAIGSNCTAAGLLVGFALAARRGIGFTEPPELMCVRVTPWPVTSRIRILSLAARASALVAERCRDPALALDRRALGAGLTLDGRYLGAGYGLATPEGEAAMNLWEMHADHTLETTYSAKSAAALVDLVRGGAPGPIVYWATKSSAPLPPVDARELAWAPRRMRRWMEEARRTI